MIRPARPSELQIGTRVTYRDRNGTQSDGVIASAPEFHPNNQPAWDVLIQPSGLKWGYLDQFYIDDETAASPMRLAA